MKKKIYYITLIFLLITIVLIKLEFYIVLPIATFLLLLIIVSDYYIIKRNIKNKTFIGLSKNYIGGGNFMLILFGSLIVILSFFGSTESKSWNGLEYNFFAGLVLTTYGIFKYNKTMILIKVKSVEFNSIEETGEWWISKIDKVEIENSKLSFIKGKKIKSFNLESHDELERNEFLRYLKEKLEDRVEIVENKLLLED